MSKKRLLLGKQKTGTGNGGLSIIKSQVEVKDYLHSILSNLNEYVSTLDF